MAAREAARGPKSAPRFRIVQVQIRGVFGGGGAPTTLASSGGEGAWGRQGDGVLLLAAECVEGVAYCTGTRR